MFHYIHLLNSFSLSEIDTEAAGLLLVDQDQQAYNSVYNINIYFLTYQVRV